MTKTGRLLHIVAILAVVALFVVPAESVRKKTGANPDMFITCEINKSDLYERESALLTVTLHSTTPEISGAETESGPTLTASGFDYIARTETDRRGRRETINGRTYYAYPLETYVVSIHQSGNYEVDGGSYRIIVQRPVVVEDPFWGRIRSVKTESVSLQSDTSKIKVNALPHAKSGENFTGAVGDFTISTTIPPGKIYLNRTGIAVITVRGRGLLGKDVLPEYNSAFNSGIRLKAVSENRRSYFDGVDIVSELVLECEFIPSEKDAEIGKISLGYFNPKTKRYEKAVSEPVTVKVESISSQIETIDV